MASKHHKIDKELELTITLKVKVDTVHDFHQLTESQLEDSVQEIKESLPETIKNIIGNSNQFTQFENCLSFDWATLELED